LIRHTATVTAHIAEWMRCVWNIRYSPDERNDEAGQTGALQRLRVRLR